jgi:transposase
MKPYDKSVRDRAVEAVARGATQREAARIAGVSPSAVARWVNPAYWEKSLRTAREWKQRQKGACIDCGAETHYAGHGRVVSERCADCGRAANRIWTRELVIEAIQRFAAERGRPPSSKDWNRKREDRGDYPSLGSVFGRAFSPFATWNEAIAAAGFQPRSPGERTSEGAESMRVAAQARRGGGARQREIIALVADGVTLRPDLVTATGMEERHLSKALTVLFRHGIHVRVGRGVYALPT